MNPDTVNITYEAISNPILRLMIWMLVGAVASLATAIVFLYREHKALQREIIAMNRESIEAMNHLGDAFDGLKNELAETRHNQRNS